MDLSYTPGVPAPGVRFSGLPLCSPRFVFEEVDQDAETPAVFALADLDRSRNTFRLCRAGGNAER